MIISRELRRTIKFKICLSMNIILHPVYTATPIVLVIFRDLVCERNWLTDTLENEPGARYKTTLKSCTLFSCR